MIYLDAHATTPLDADVAASVRPWVSAGVTANAGSPNAAGEAAGEAISTARSSVARLVGATPSSVFFMSGATESNNLCLSSLTQLRHSHILTSPTEHASVLRPLEAARDAGLIELELVPVGTKGTVSVEDISRRVRPDTAALSFQVANNETGLLNPIEEIGELAAAHEILFHSDAAQAAGKIPINIATAQIDLLSISGHKMYGPLGAGAVAASPNGVRALNPQIRGGGQESGIRSGTVNVPSVVGLGCAADIAAQRMTDDADRLGQLRDEMCDALLDAPGTQINGTGSRLPGSLSITFEGVPSDALIANCPSLYLSSGSACSAGSPKPSHVLLAMGLEEEQVEQTIRVGLHRDISRAEVRQATDEILQAVDRVRGRIYA